MDILSSITSITTEFAGKIQENHLKHREKKVSLKKVIAETARAQAQLILEDETDDNMGDPTVLCNKLAELRLQYNSIIVKQKEEFEKIMSDYSNAIYLCLGKIVCTSNVVEKATIFDKFCNRGINIANTHNLTSETKWPKKIGSWQPKTVSTSNTNFNCTPQQFMDNYRNYAYRIRK